MFKIFLSLKNNNLCLQCYYSNIKTKLIVNKLKQI